MIRHRLVWLIASLVVATFVIAPIVALLILAAQGDAEIWDHLRSTVLADYVINSLSLAIGVALISTVLGVVSAVLISQYQFPGKGFFEWALLLPLAMPAYITAYAYTGLLDVAGPAQVLIRSQFNLAFGDYWFPQIRSLGGAIFVLSFVLYPYIYVLTRAALLRQGNNYRDAARSLGLSTNQALFRVCLPRVMK